MLQLLCTDLRDDLACFGRYGRQSPAEIVVCDRNESVPISLEQIKLSNRVSAYVPLLPGHLVPGDTSG